MSGTHKFTFMNLRLLSVLKYFLLLTVALLLLFFAFKNVSLRIIFNEMLQANIWWLALSTLISFIALISRAYRWKLLIEPLGYCPTLKNTTYSVAVGYFANLAFPRLGEVTRCGSLGTAEGIPFNKLLGTVVVERILDIVSLFICIVLVAIIEFNRLGQFLKKNIADPLYFRITQILSSVTGIVVLVLFIIAVTVSIRMFIRYRKRKSKSKWSDIINGFIKGLISIKYLHKPWQFIFHSVLIWSLYYTSVYVCLFALPFTSHLGLAAALFLLVAGGLGMSAPVQGGIGAYHLLVSQGLLLYGVTLENGLAFATLLHSLQLIMVVLTGALALLLLFFQKKYKPIQTTPSAVGKH
jgi:glycosyltransferase 2 family protein